jgi:ketosteroid isomerase-like protein
MSQENVEIVRRGIEAFNRRDIASIRADAHPQIEWIEDSRYPGAQTFHGPDGVEESVRRWWEAWDIELDPEDFLDLGERVVVSGHGRYRGHESDVTLTAEFAGVYEVRENKVVRVEVLESRRAALEAVGLSE